MAEFAIGTSAPGLHGDVLWHSKPASFNECLHVLTHNGRSDSEARAELRHIQATESYTIVNDICQITG